MWMWAQEGWMELTRHLFRAALHSMLDLSSLTGDQTPVHRSGSTDLNHWTTQHLCRETNTKTQMKGTPSLLKP